MRFVFDMYNIYVGRYTLIIHVPSFCIWAVFGSFFRMYLISVVVIVDFEEVSIELHGVSVYCEIFVGVKEGGRDLRKS